MSERKCGNCRFFRPGGIYTKDETEGMCDFELPDFLKKYDDDITLRRMSQTNYCSFHRKKKVL